MATEYFNDAWRIPNNKNQSLVSNYSMDFDGTNDFINISDPTELTDDFTIAAWIYPTRVDNSYEMIYTQGDGTVPAYFAVKDTKLHVYITGQYETALGFINANEWQHVAVTRTSGVLNLYKNGVEYNGNRPTQNGTINNNSDGVIGKWYNSSHYFKGKIDQVCIFDYALPATGTNSVATLYGGGTAVTNPMSLSPAPVAYYQLGDQSAYNGANYLVPNNSLDGFVFRSVPAQTTAAIPPNTITSNINYTGTPASPSGFTVSFWVKGIGPFGSGQEQLIFDHSATTFTAGVFSFQSGSILFRFGNGTYRYYTIPSGIDFNDWNNIVVYFEPGDRSAGKVWINGGTPLALSTGGGSSYNDFTSGFRLYLNSFNSNVMYFKNYEIDNANATLLYNNGSPLSNTSTLAQAPDHWWRLNADDTFDSGTSTWTIKDYIGSEDGTSVNMTSNNLVISDLSNTGGASGYSPYALDLDGINDSITANFNFPLLTTNFSFSVWIKPESTTIANVFIANNDSSSDGYNSFIVNNSVYFRLNSSDVISSISGLANTWIHVVGTYDGSTQKLYINNNTPSTKSFPTSLSVNDVTLIGVQENLTNFFNGSISNVSLYNTTLTDLQVTEIYNSGVPSNLNTFSGTAPVAWWQLGSNSSFNPNPTGTEGSWTCLDEIGTNNAVSSTNMANDDITNGVGYSANGLGTSSIEIVGDAPYSTANGISENMDVLDRTTDVPS